MSLTYRLGALGFVRLRHLLGDDFAGSENNALRDIALGLQWVRDNIAAFGGDSSRITLAGESAGAKNTVSCLAMPGVRDIVAGAISQSGSAITLLTPEQAEGVTAALLERLDIREADAERLLHVEHREIVNAQARLKGVNFPWRAVVDGTVLPTSVLDATRAGALKDIALLIGTNADEYDTFAVANRAINSSDPTTANTTHLESATTLQRMLTAYEDLLGRSVSDRERRIRLLTAEEYWIPSLRLVEAQLAGGGSPYSYRFGWRPRVRHPLRLRAAHGMEVPFVFGTLRSAQGRAFTLFDGRPEHEVAIRMQRAWTDFIARGQPADPSVWPSYGHDRNVMVIDNEWTLRQDPNAAERRIWEAVL